MRHLDIKRLHTALSDRNIQILMLITLLGAFLRLYQLGTESVWLDEAWTVNACSQSFGGMLSDVMGDVHPPLYYIMLYPVIKLFGSSEIALRLPSVIFGVLTIPLLYLVGERLFGRREGMVGAFLLSISLHHLYHSQEARMYSMLTFMVLLSVYLFWRSMEEPDNLKLWVFWGLVLLMSVYTHYFAALMLPAFAVYLVWLHITNDNASSSDDAPSSKSAVRGFLLGLCMVVVGFLPWLNVLAGQMGGKLTGQAMYGVRSPSEFFSTFFANMAPTIFVEELEAYNVIVTLIFMAFFFTGVWGMARSNTRRAFVFLLTCILIPLLIGFCMMYLLPFIMRYMIFVGPFFMLFAAGGILHVCGTAFRNRLARGAVSSDMILAGTVCVVLLISAPAFNVYYSSPEVNDWRSAASYLDANAGSDDVIAVLPASMRLPFEYYYGGDASVIAPDVSGLDAALSGCAGNNTMFVVISTSDLQAVKQYDAIVAWLDSHNSSIEARFQVWLWVIRVENQTT